MLGKYGEIEYCKVDKVFLEIKKAMLLFYLSTEVRACARCVAVTVIFTVERHGGSRQN